ncbi:ABC transporter substrate-binding protein [Wukongibacter sp. M2B1]|uniref:ABC transporter substrate-binding protein n=1 Tax=Wukongibacter sp. M2B1 TaxID=3088895 RepID=UPI003D795C63
MHHKYKVYWNNVCLLSRLEQSIIDKKLAAWKRYHEESFEFKYLGLGKKKKLYEQVYEDLDKGNVEADAIISTDLDIFQRNDMLTPRLDDYRETGNIFPIRKELIKTTIPHPSKKIHPFLVIPLVMVVNKSTLDDSHIPNSFEALCNPYYKDKVVFGGIDTSAVKSVLMTLWYMYGEKMINSFIRNSKVTSLPALAFSRVMHGDFPIAIVPSIFALRKGIGSLMGIWPKEGAISIPSYVIIKNSLPLDKIGFLRELLFREETQNLFSQDGCIVPVHPNSHLPNWAKENNCRLLYPQWKWIEELDFEKFDMMCDSVTRL